MTKEQIKEEAKKEFDMFSVYYRSVFSRDCSREETEEEKSTEMIERQNGLNLLLSQIDKAYEEGKKELINKLEKKQPPEEIEFSFRDEYERKGYNECIEELKNLTK